MIGDEGDTDMQAAHSAGAKKVAAANYITYRGTHGRANIQIHKIYKRKIPNNRNQ